MTIFTRLSPRLLIITALALLCLLGQPDTASAQQPNKPSAPSFDALTASEQWLAVRWTAPSGNGSALTNYDVRHIRTDATDKTDSNWTLHEDVQVARAGNRLYVANGLTTGVEYDVQVRAINANGDGAWSATRTVTPADAPSSRTDSVTLELKTLWSGAIRNQHDNRFEGTISSGTDVDYYKIVLTGSMVPTIHGFWIYAESEFDTQIELLNNNGTRVTSSDDSGYLPNPRDSLLAANIVGTYYIKVSSYGADQGSYVLKVRSYPETSSRTNAADLTVGQIATGHLSTTSNEDYYKITLAAQTDLIVRSDGRPDNIGQLQSSNGTALESNDDGLLPQDPYQFLIRRTLDAGTYYLRVRGYDEGETGPYTVQATVAGSPGSTTATANELKLGHAGGGNISAIGDTDHFSIAVAQETYVTIWAVHNSASFDADAELLDSAGLAVTEDYLHDFAADVGFGIEHKLTAGIHYLKVKGDSGTSTGKYTVLATENNAYTRLVDRCTDIARSTGINDALYGCQWHLKNNGQFSGGASQDINVEPVWAGGNLGAGITVAVVDDGLDHQHPDLSANVDVSKNHDYNGDNLVYDPLADHGTAVAGVIAAANNTFGMRGVAPGASIYGYNLLNTANTFAEITQQNTANAMSRNAATTAVSNNSWGPPDSATHQPANTFWREAIDSGIKTGYGGKGTFYVFPAGNGGRYGDNSNLDEYANQWGTTAVCAVDHTDVRAPYSEPGTNVWVCAPSSGDPKSPAIATTTVQGRYSDEFTGTSVATPQVSGLAALLRKANPDLTWRDIKIILASSARKNDATDSGWEEGGLKYGSATERYQFNHQYGFGVIDAKAAIDLAADWQLLPPLRTASGSGSATPLTIPDASSDNPGAQVTSTVTLDGAVEFIEYVTLHTQFDHTSIRDMDVELVAPSGKVSKLLPYYDNSDGTRVPYATINTIFQLGSAKHLGESAEGTWTLKVQDHYLEDTGMLQSWSITAYGHRMTPGVPTLLPLAQHSAGGLSVAWTEPTQQGSSPIESYDIRYIKSDATDKTDSNWTERTGIWSARDLAYHLNGLTAQTEYDVQVRAVNKLKNGDWATTQTATTGDNALPTISGCDMPSLTNRWLAWHGTLTVGEQAIPAQGSRPRERIGWGYYEGVGAISGKTTAIVLGSNAYRIGDLLMQFDIDEAVAPLIAPPTGALVLNLTRDLTSSDEGALVLHICDEDFAFADSDRPEGHDTPDPAGVTNTRDDDYYWKESGLEWTEGLVRILAFSMTGTRQAVAAPAVSGAPTISEAGDDGQWTQGETVLITLTFTERVNVDTSGGRPSLSLLLGGTEERTAPYRSGSGSTSLVFSYTLTDSDGAHSSMLVPEDSLALAGGTIRSQNTDADAALTHNGAAVTAIPTPPAQEENTQEEDDQGTTNRNDENQPAPVASFHALPQSHDGETPFTVELRITPVPEEISYTDIQAAVEATGSSVSSARRITAGENGAWEIGITPNQGADITLELPARECSEVSALCINDEPFTETAQATVPGQPFRATLVGVPPEHDGSNSLDLELHFSHEPTEDLSYRTVQDGLLDLTGVTIDRVWRLDQGVNRRWGITITPTGLDDIAIRVLETTDCAAEDAVCDVAGRTLPGGAESLIQGPPTLSVQDTEVQEAQDAQLTFTLTLSRPLDVPVEVSYATQDGTATAGADYTTVSGSLTFGAGITEQTVSVEVTRDEDDSEPPETITLRLSNASPEQVRLADETATGTIR